MEHEWDQLRPSRWRSRRDFTARRFIEPTTAALLVGGIAAGVGGGVLASSSSNRAARQQRDFFDRRTQGAQDRLFGSFLGLDSFSDLHGSGAGPQKFDKDGNPIGVDPFAASQRFNERIGGPIFDQINAAGEKAKFGFGQQRKLLEQLFGRQNQLAFNAPGKITQKFASASAPLKSAIEGFGRGREDQIREDAGLALRELNQRTTALGSGFGVNTNEIVGQAGNQREVNRATDRSLTDLGDAKTRLLTETLSPFLFSGAQASSNAELAAIERLFPQAVTSSQLGERNVGRAFDLETNAIRQLMQLNQSPTANPFLGAGAQGVPVGGGSGLGTALISGGNAAGGIGGLLLAKELFGNAGTTGSAASGGHSTGRGVL